MKSNLQVKSGLVRAALARPLTSTLVDLFCVGTVMTLLTYWSWEKWPDVFVDFGRELYIPWRLLEGERLFSDIAYFNGPFSPHFNSLAFRVFGVSIQTIHLVNLFILGLIVLLFYFGLRVLTDRLTSLVGVFFFLSVFAFAQYLDIGNFNFVAPYSHEMTHGMLVSLLALACGVIYLRRNRTMVLYASGFFLGVTLLTKAEYFLASSCGLVMALAVQLWITNEPIRTWLRTALTVMAAALTPAAVALSLLLLAHPPSIALPALLGTWSHVSAPGLRELAFYQESLGIDHLAANLGSAGLWTLVLAVFVAVGIALTFWLSPRVRLRPAALVIIAATPWFVIFLGRETIAWSSVARTLPFWLTTLLFVLLVMAKRSRARENPSAQIPIWVLSASFSLALLAKIIFNTRFYQYGFALAAPATLAGICVLTYSIPVLLNQRGLWAPAFRLWSISAVLALASLHLVQTQHFLSKKTVRVGEGRDAFWADSRGLFANQVRERIQARAADTETLAVLPEGVMINYLERKVNSTPFINFMPPELLIFGEQAMIQSFNDSRPDFILLVNRPATEYGLKLLGRDYGEDLMQWVQTNYSMREQIREPTIEGQPFSFGLLLTPNR